MHPSSAPLLLFLLFVLSIWTKKPKCYLTQRVGKSAQHPDKRSERKKKVVGDKSCMGLCVKAWIVVQTLLLHAASRPVPFKVELKRWAQATLQVLPSWLQSPRHGLALRWDSRQRNNLTLVPCWFSAHHGPDGASRQRHRGSYLSSRSPAPPGAFLFPLGTTSLGAHGHTGQEQGQTSGLQEYRSGCCLQKATEREREEASDACIPHALHQT